MEERSEGLMEDEWAEERSEGTEVLGSVVELLLSQRSAFPHIRH